MKFCESHKVHLRPPDSHVALPLYIHTIFNQSWNSHFKILIPIVLPVLCGSLGNL